MDAAGAAADRPGGGGGGRRVAAIQVAVSVLALAGVAWWASRQDVPKLPPFSEAVGPLCGAVAVYTLATLLRGERWWGLLHLGGVPAGRFDAYAVTTVGYMGNNALPARAGDVMKAMLCAREAGAPRRDAFGALVAERLLDALALVTIFVALVLVAGLPVGLSTTMLVLVGAGLAVAAVAVVALTPRLRGVLAALLAPSRRLLSRRGGLLLALSLAVWLAEGAVYAIVGHVAGIGLSLADGLYVMALANLAAMIPAAPGYVGTYDAAVLLGVRLTGGGAAHVALPYVVLVRFVLFVPITVVGLVFLLGRYGGVRTLRAARASG